MVHRSQSKSMVTATARALWGDLAKQLRAQVPLQQVSTETIRYEATNGHPKISQAQQPSQNLQLWAPRLGNEDYKGMNAERALQDFQNRVPGLCWGSLELAQQRLTKTFCDCWSCHSQRCINMLKFTSQLKITNVTIDVATSNWSMLEPLGQYGVVTCCDMLWPRCHCPCHLLPPSGRR